MSYSDDSPEPAIPDSNSSDSSSSSSSIPPKKSKFDPALESSIKSNISDQKQLMTDVLNRKNPAPPSVPTPPEPPKYEPKDPLDAFKSFAPMLAIFGSLKTRHPLTTAIGAFTAAMKAQAQGDADTYAKKRDEYKDQMEYVNKQHEYEQAQYKDILDATNKTDQEKLSAMKALAAMNKDELLLHYINSGDIDGATDLITNKRSKAGEGLRDTNGNLLPTLGPETINAYADAIADGVPIGSLGLGRGDLAKNPDKRAIMDAVVKRHPGINMADVEANFGGLKQEKRTVGAAAGRIKLAANSLSRAIPLARDAADAVDLTEYPSINSIENEARNQNGDPKIKRLYTALQTVMTDYSSLIARNGVPTDSTRAAARELVNTSMSRGQLEAVFDQMELEKSQQLEAVKDTKNDFPDPETKTIGDKTYHKDDNGDWYAD